jgi:hypothetical protein
LAWYPLFHAISSSNNNWPLLLLAIWHHWSFRGRNTRLPVYGPCFSPFERKSLSLSWFFYLNKLHWRCPTFHAEGGNGHCWRAAGWQPSESKFAQKNIPTFVVGPKKKPWRQCNLMRECVGIQIFIQNYFPQSIHWRYKPLVTEYSF